MKKRIFKTGLMVGLCSIFFVAGVFFNEARMSVSNSGGITPGAVLDMISPDAAYAHTHATSCYIETYAQYSSAQYGVYNDYCNNSSKFKVGTYANEMGLRWACQQAALEIDNRINSLPHY